MGYCPPHIEHCLSGRIITPIYDICNDLIAVSSRHLDSTKKGVERFWHESFDKGSYLYGLPYAKNNIIKKKKAIVVEGEMDVACLHSYDFNTTVGVSGSSFTLFQAALLGRYCSDVYFLLDGDTAGYESMRRISKIFRIHSLQAYGLRYIPVTLPNGYDPDEFVIQNGRKALIELLVNAEQEYNLIN